MQFQEFHKYKFKHAISAKVSKKKKKNNYVHNSYKKPFYLWVNLSGDIFFGDILLILEKVINHVNNLFFLKLL